jgi:hypothetical protein
VHGCGHEHWERYYSDYAPPPPEKIHEWGIAFKAIYQRVCDDLKLDLNKYHLDVEALREVFIRSDKRYLHYIMYHNGTKMDEIKRLSEIVYWAMRLNVITRKTDNPDDAGVRILASFFMYALAGWCGKKGYAFSTLDENAHDYLIYALKYRELSRDALVLLAEGLIAKSKATTTE